MKKFIFTFLLMVIAFSMTAQDKKVIPPLLETHWSYGLPYGRDMHANDIQRGFCVTTARCQVLHYIGVPSSKVELHRGDCVLPPTTFNHDIMLNAYRDCENIPQESIDEIAKFFHYNRDVGGNEVVPEVSAIVK